VTLSVNNNRSILGNRNRSGDCNAAIVDEESFARKEREEKLAFGTVEDFVCA
jgi:hypothetical protein